MADFYFHLNHLFVGYNGKAIIKDIEIGISRGEIVTLIGPNGAGKSTILKSITRQLPLVAGQVKFDGKELREYSYKELSCKMAVVLTERMKPELMTCHDVVATGRYPYTGRLGILSHEDERIVENALRAVHAEEIGSRDFNAISDGQRQRVLLARAICQEPDIILLDEPTSFLDVRHKLELLSILRSMAKEKNITVIMSLHEIDLAMKISDRILCVKGEHIFKEGAPEEIFDEEMIRDLYEIDNGYFDPLFGSIELPKPTGKRRHTQPKEGAAGAEAMKDVEGVRNPEQSSRSEGKERPDDLQDPGKDTEVPRVFVISAAGSGIPVYRRLQKEDTPFMAGILWKNDVDYRLARLLAAECFAAETFEEISDELYENALAAMKTCDRVIDAGIPKGPQGARLRELLTEAEKLGILEK